MSHTTFQFRMATNCGLLRIGASAVCVSALYLISGCSLTSPPSNGRSEDKPVATTAKPLTNVPPPGFFLPEGFFTKPPAPAPKVDITPPTRAEPAGASGSTSTPMFAGGFTQEVVLYASVNNKAYYATGGLDYGSNSLAWEGFLRKYRIPYKLVTTVEQLEKAPLGVLLLPSAVVLSDKERNAIAMYRSLGGSVLSTWLTGIRNDKGGLVGLEFMDKVLDVKVTGTTETSPDDGFLIVHGNTPVSHHLASGTRVWLERAKGWFPLQLSAKNSAASMMPWTRKFTPDKAISVIGYDEKTQSNGRASRAVVLGYPERLWQTSDPKALEAIAHNALMWLLRQPDAYMSDWPNPYTSAFVMGVDSTDVLAGVDVSFAKRLEDVGGRATYYLLTDVATKSAENAKKIQAKGHEIAYLADKYEGFQGQSLAVQTRRFDTMRTVLSDLGIEVGKPPGFRPPMGSSDATTQKLVAERGFGHFVATMGDTDTRLPFVLAKAEGTNNPLIGIPSTQTGPEEWIDDADVEDGLQAFLDELALAQAMGGVSFVRVPNQTLMAPDQLDTIFDYLKEQRARMWMASGRQVADWWRERVRLSARLDSNIQAPVLTVTVSAGAPLKNAAYVLVNMPDANTSVRLVPVAPNGMSAKLSKIDNWRSAVIIEGLLPGTYQWYANFDRSASSGVK